MTNTISTATRRNWKRLNSSHDGKLTTRANKRMSAKKIVPIEYFSNANNIQLIQNILENLEKSDFMIEDIIYSIAILLLKKNHILNKINVKKVLNEYSFTFIDGIQHYPWPEDERDLLGIVYQCLLQEGDKNKKGSYYTPIEIVHNMINNLDFSKNQSFLDPCCGSGSFLLEINANPEQIYGIDNDPIAVFISKINLLIKFADYNFIPNIECRNFLEETNLFSIESNILNRKYDYIITNPPWGAVTNDYNIHEISSKETFSCFFVKSFYLLKKRGIINLLLPKSVTNVKLHKDIRKFILESCCIESFTEYDNSFTGVTTKYIALCCSKRNQQPNIPFYHSGSTELISISSFKNTENFVFNFLNSKDLEIINAVKSIGKYDLSKSIWALGVVTGNNKSKISHISYNGMEKIYTGKEIFPYILKDSNNYILYDRNNLQQVAKEEFYRAPEKLVYKFISNKLTFAYDDKQRLFLNSANILIPKIQNMSVKTVLAFLNSELYQFLYLQMFGEIKILKGNLIELPFPELSLEQDMDIAESVNRLLNGECNTEIIQNKIYDIFNISEKQIKYIRSVLNGKVA